MQIRDPGSRIEKFGPGIRYKNPGSATSVVDPGCLSRIPDPTFFHPGSRDPNCLHPGSRILIKEFKYFNPKKANKWFLSTKKYDPGCSSRIPDPDADFLPSRIQGSKRHPIPDPGSESATLSATLFVRFSAADLDPDPGTWGTVTE
jgi:hypothetical protein